MTSPEIKALATSATTFVDQTKKIIHTVQTEDRELKATVATVTMVQEMKAECEVQTKASAENDKKVEQGHRRHQQISRDQEYGGSRSIRDLQLSPTQGTAKTRNS